jgi:hypothetical protein
MKIKHDIAQGVSLPGALALILLLAVSCTPRKDAYDMHVSFLPGDAEKGAHGDWSALHLDDYVYTDNSVRTRKNSILDVDLSGLAGLRLLENSEVNLAML